MSASAKSRTVAYLAGVLMAIAAIAWANSQIWFSVTYLRARAEAIGSNVYHLSDSAEAKIRELSENALRFSLAPSDGLRAAIVEEHRQMRDWLATNKASLTLTEHRDAYIRLQTKFERYSEHLAPILSGGDLGDRADWRQENETVVADLVHVLRELSAAERSALNTVFRETRRSMDKIKGVLTLASVVLLASGAALALLIYQGFVAPLRQRLRQTRAAMERQEKLTSLGVLAAGVAHEIRNPLTSIKARLFTQKSLLTEKTDAWEDNLFITEEISRLERIVRDFLSFARPSDPEMVRTNAAQPFRDLDALIRRSLEKANIVLAQDFQSEAPIQADPHQLKQVLLNLVQNAAESIGTQGKITLRTRIDNRRRSRTSTPVVLLEVEDTGPGIPEDVQKRLFDPFFTTKPSGTGLGLSIAARILEKHRGFLEYETERNRGTVFRVVLPIA